MRAGAPVRAVGQRLRPHDVAVAADHRVGAAELVRLVRIERRVDAAEDDVRARRARQRADSYPRSALPVWMPMPTMSPGWMRDGSSGSSVSSVMIGSPYSAGVAAASTYSQRGVMTPMPNET